MSPLELLAATATLPAPVPVARWIAALVFLGLIAALSWGLLRAKKQLLHDEADAAIEADFRRLEQESRR